MPATLHETDLEERLATLERRFEQLVGPLYPPDVDDARESHVGYAEPPAPPIAAGGRVWRPSPAPSAATFEVSRFAHPRTRTPRRRSQPLSDVVGGRLLAWLGGIATLTGIVLFLALAVSHGWIGEQARVCLAAAVSSGLMASGAWLHSRRGRTEAARALVGAATAGLYCTLLVASQVYGLVPSMLALGLSLVVGAIATTLAIRWAGRAVGALGLIGALVSPLLVGAAMSGATVALLALACACAMAVVVRQRWTWLGLAAVLVCAPQWGSWVLAGQGAGVDFAVLGAFAALGLIGALGAQTLGDPARLPLGSAALTALSACLVAVIGHLALHDASGRLPAELWLTALAGSHILLGVCRFRRLPVATPMRELAIALGVVLADVAFGLGANGAALVLGWAGAAAGFAYLVRRTTTRSKEEALVGLGLGAHITLTLVRALIDSPPSALGSGELALLPLLSVAALAATCLVSARLVGGERALWRHALEVMGLAAIAYLTAAALSGPALVCAWCAEAIALSRLTRGGHGPVARYGALAFIALAVGHVLLIEAPPSALITGTHDLGAAALGIAASALGTFCVARAFARDEVMRVRLFAGSAAALLYIGSVAVVTMFQPGAETSPEPGLDLTVRQEGQVLLSTLWGAVGLAALIVGLRRGHAALRSIALGWLLICVAKVFLYDLSTLSSIYRVISFFALGLLLLAGAYAYQRLRPPPLPDMREMHPSQR